MTTRCHAHSKAACLTITSGMLVGRLGCNQSGATAPGKNHCGIAANALTTDVGDLVVNPAGFRGAFTRDADGRGYVLEYAIPWWLLNAADDPPRSGDVLAAAWQVHWSDASGRLWRDQMAEIRNRQEPPRILVWERAATWGRTEFR